MLGNSNLRAVILAVASLLSLEAWANAPEAYADPKREAAALKALLSSSDPSQLRAGFAMAAGASAHGHKLAAERVRRGLPRPVLIGALGALSRARKSEPLVTLLSELTLHRSSKVRVLAVENLGLLDAREAEAAVAARLSDMSPAVREAATTALSHIGSRASQDLLARAVARGIPGAAEALGNVVEVGQLGELSQALKRVPMMALAPMYDALLSRDDLRVERRVGIVSGLEARGSSGARAYLEGLKLRLPRLPSELLRAAEVAAERIEP